MSGEHWMGLVMNKSTNSCVYFDSFGRQFPWLEETLKKHFKTIHLRPSYYLFYNNNYGSFKQNCTYKECKCRAIYKTLL